MGSQSYSSRLWSAKGLEACACLVGSIGRGELDGKFKILDVPQLLKHLLGLRNNHGEHFELFYLWYDMPGFEEADRHREEIERFVVLLGGEVSFRAITYQHLYERFAANCAGINENYLDRFAGRYL